MAHCLRICIQIVCLLSIIVLIVQSKVCSIAVHVFCFLNYTFLEKLLNSWQPHDLQRCQSEIREKPQMLHQADQPYSRALKWRGNSASKCDAALDIREFIIVELFT